MYFMAGREFKYSISLGLKKIEYQDNKAVLSLFFKNIELLANKFKKGGKVMGSIGLANP